MHLLILVLVTLFWMGGPAHAGFIAAIVAAIGFSGAVATAITGFLINTMISVALSLLSRVLMKGKEQSGGGISRNQTMAGADVSQSFIVGLYGTAGSFMAPKMSHGGDNKFLTYVIALSDLPGAQMNRLFVDGVEVYLRNNLPTNEYGVQAADLITIEEENVRNERMNPSSPFFGFYTQLFARQEQGTGNKKYQDKLRVKYHNGSQTVADPMLVSKYGSAATRPWTSSMIAKDCCYAILTFEYDRNTYSDLPSVMFEMLGVPLYDPRKDSSIGGSGTHRWDNKATWETTANPVIIIYNILRGIRLPDGRVWGGECEAEDLPLAVWSVEANKCDEVKEYEPGKFMPRYRCGLEIEFHNDEPVDIIDELKKTCAAEMVEIGGVYTIRVGGPGLPVAFLTDSDLRTDIRQEFTPFPGLDRTYNIVTAMYPDPAQNWKTNDAPIHRNAAFIAQDQNRELPAQVTLSACPFIQQVQSLQNSWLLDNRKWRTHVISVGHVFAHVKALDCISWTSARNGYSSKLFDVQQTIESCRSLQQSFEIRETDPSDYDFNAAALLPTEIINPFPVSIIAPSLTSFQVEQYIGIDNDDNEYIAGFRFVWDPVVESAVQRIVVKIRHGVTGQELPGVVIEDIAAGAATYTSGIIPNQPYILNAKPVMDRPSVWTADLSIMSPNVYMPSNSLTPDVWDQIEAIASQAGVPTVNTLPATGSRPDQIVMKVPEGILYRWDEASSSWNTNVFGGIPDGSITIAKIAAGLEVPLAFSGAIPTTRQASDVLFRTDDGKLYQWRGGAYVATVPSTDITGQMTNAQIAALDAAKLSGTMSPDRIGTGALLGTKLADSAITTAKLADAAVTFGKFASGIEPVGIIAGSVLPTVKTTTTIVMQGQLYRWDGSAYVKTVVAGDITGQITSAQIASIAAGQVTGQLTNAQIAALDAAKLTGTMSPDRIATGALLGTKLADAAVTVAKLADNSVIASKIADAAVTLGKFASGIEPVTNVTGSLPTVKSTTVITFNGELYRWNGTAYAKNVASADITGAITNAQIEALAASKVTGQLTDAQIAAVGAAKVTGQLTSTQIADNAVTLAKIANGSVSVAKFATGIEPVTLVTGSLPTVKSTTVITFNNELYRWNGTAYVKSVSTGDLTGTITAAQIASVNASVIAGQITGTQITDNAITSPKIATGAITAGKVAAGAIEAGSIAAGAVTTEKLDALAVTSDKVSANAITAGKIAAGVVTATEIASGAITASKLAITDMQNLIPNGEFTQGLEGWGIATNATVVDVSGYASGKAVLLTRVSSFSAVCAYGNYNNSGVFDVAVMARAGESFYMEFYARRDVAGSVISRMLGKTSATGTPVQWGVTTNTVTSTWTKFSSVYTAAEDGRVFFEVYNPTNNSTAHVSGIRVYRRNAGSLIVDGSIVANMIAAQAVTASKLFIGDTSNIFPDPDFVDASLYTGAAFSLLANTWGSSRNYLNINSVDGTVDKTVDGPLFSVEQNLEYQFARKIGIAGSAPQTPAILGVSWYSDFAGTVLISSDIIQTSSLTGTRTVRNASILTAPATAVRARLTFTRQGHATSTTVAVFNEIVIRRASAGELIVDGAVIASKIATDAVTANAIAANAVTAAAIAADAVTAAKIQAGAVETAKIAAGAVVADKVAASAITTAKLDALAVTADKIAVNAITAAKIAAGAVVSDAIAAGAITTGKLAIIDMHNLVPNGEFTQGFEGWGRIAAATVVDVSGYASGKAALLARVTTESSISAYGNYNTSGVYDVAVPASTGDSFAIEFYSRRDNPSPLRVQIVGKTGATIAPTTWASTDVAITANWAKYSVSLTANNSGRVFFRFANETNNTSIWVSGVRIYRRNAGELIVDGAITANLIAASAVTAGKIAAGAVTAGTIAAGAVTANDIAANAITSVKIEAGAIVAGKIAVDAITADNISANAVTTAKINVGAVTTAKIAALAIEAGNIAAGAVIADKLAANAVTADKIAANAVTAGKIAAGVVTATEIASGAITTSKLAVADFTNLVPNAILANNFEGWMTSSTANQWNRAVADANFGGINMYKYTAASAITGYTSAQNSSQFPVEPGKSYYFGGRVRTNSLASTTDLILRLNWVQADGVTPATPSYINTRSGSVSANFDETIGGSATAPANAVFAYVNFHLQRTGVAVGSVFDLGEFVVKRRSGGELIVDGAITANTIATNAVTTAKIAVGAVTANEIASNAVTAIKIEAGAVIAGKLAVDAVVANNIAANAVTTVKIATGAVTANEISANAIIAGKVAANAITAGTIAASAVGADQIAAKAVTASKLVLTDSDNLIPDGNFETADLALVSSAGSTTRLTYLTDTTGTGINILRWSRLTSDSNGVDARLSANYMIPVVSNETYWGEASVKAATSGSANGVHYRVIFYAADKTTVVGAPSFASGNLGTSWQPLSGKVVAPANAVFMQWSITSTVAGGTAVTVDIDRIAIRRANAAQLVVDGGITANHLAVNSVTANAIAASAITATAIAAGAVTAAKISVANLSAINSNLGAITAGSININGLFIVAADGKTTIRSAATGARLVFENNRIAVYDEASVLRIEIGELT